MLYEVPGGDQVDGFPPVASSVLLESTADEGTGSAPKNLFLGVLFLYRSLLSIAL